MDQDLLGGFGYDVVGCVRRWVKRGSGRVFGPLEGGVSSLLVVSGLVIVVLSRQS